MTETNKKILKEFVYFLKTNNAYEEFIINFRNRNLQYASKRNGRKFMSVYTNNYDCARNIINHAFIWNSTPQGHYYWSNLHVIWERICAKK